MPKRILIIDSHKGTNNSEPTNMHFINSRILANHLFADLIWSYPDVNKNIKENYDIIVFVHASHYAYTDYEWIQKSPNANLFYITNEYNLGEPRTLWMAAKDGRRYTVIANHPHETSKIVMKYVSDWINLNINCLSFCIKKKKESANLFDMKRSGCVYYGSYRAGRKKYFTKYLDENVILSTHSKNIAKFNGVRSKIIPRINWNDDGLFKFKNSLYLEDESTHVYYNHLANRFYEALSYGVVPIFSEECLNTVNLSGYKIPIEYFVSNSKDIKNRSSLEVLPEWLLMAQKEKETTLNNIASILGVPGKRCE